jgi:hypothetical protein
MYSNKFSYEINKSDIRSLCVPLNSEEQWRIDVVLVCSKFTKKKNSFNINLTLQFCWVLLIYSSRCTCLRTWIKYVTELKPQIKTLARNGITYFKNCCLTQWDTVSFKCSVTILLKIFSYSSIDHFSAKKIYQNSDLVCYSFLNVITNQKLKILT